MAISLCLPKLFNCYCFLVFLSHFRPLSVYFSKYCDKPRPERGINKSIGFVAVVLSSQLLEPPVTCALLDRV